MRAEGEAPREGARRGRPRRLLHFGADCCIYRTTDLLAGHADPFSTAEALFVARVIADRQAGTERAARSALERGAHLVYPRDDADLKIAVGRLRARRLAAFFGWEVTGYDYPGEGARFAAPNGDVRLEGPAMSTLLAYVYATEKKARSE